MLGFIKEITLDENLKDTLQMFEVFGFKITDLMVDIDNFKVELKRNLGNVTDKSLDINLMQLLLITLKLANKIFYPNLKENEIIYNLLNLEPSFSDERISIEIDVLSTKTDIYILEAYCYNEKGLLIGKANSLLHLN